MFTENFQSKSATVRYMSRILKRGSPLDSFDKLLVLEVFERHYKYEEEGRAGTLVEEPFLLPLRGHLTFAFPRAEGRPPWKPSYKTAIHGPNREKQARDAMWRDIRPQMVSFKEEQLASQIVIDPFTREILNRDNCEADHDSAFYSFAELVDAWLLSEGLILSDLEVVDDPSTEFHTIKDPQLRQSWRRFHRAKAKLRLLSKTSHEEITRRQLK